MNNFSKRLKDTDTDTMQNKLLDLILDQGALTKDEIARFHRNDGEFDNIFVIDTHNSIDHLKKSSNALKKVGLRFTRFSSITDKALLDKKYAKYFSGLRSDELIRLLNHLAIAALASEHCNENNFTVIFEDDITTESGEKTMRNTLSEIKKIDDHENIQIVYFGKCLERCGQMVQMKDTIYRAVSPSCCHAYAIKNSFAKKVFRDLDNCSRYKNSVLNCNYFNRGIDSIYGDYIVNNMISGLVLHPSIFFTEDAGKNRECIDDGSTIEDSPVKMGNGRGCERWIRLIIVVVLMVIIVIACLIWQKSRIKKLMTNKVIKVGLLGLGLLIIKIIGAIIIIKVIAKSKKPQATWNTDFPEPPKPVLKTISKYSSSIPKHFMVDSTMLASKEYQVFNPNGIMIPADSWHNRSSRSQSDKLDMITTSRCFNGKVSYPLLQVYNQSMSYIKYSKPILIESHRSIKSNNDVLGYEDMRIFKFNGDLYLIGVNLDRSPISLPGMVLVKLNSNFESEETWHLKYSPISKFPNKNWSPFELPDGELGFVVDIDPLLIVKRTKSKDRPGKWSAKCELVYEAKSQTAVEKVRNSTVTYEWKDIPRDMQTAFEVFAPKLKYGHLRYVLMGHTKYLETNMLRTHMKIIYQHYFAVIDLPVDSYNSQDRQIKPKVYLSSPFYVEESNKPHIEYISGVTFIPECSSYKNSQIVIMYGLRDAEAKYIRLDAQALESLLRGK